MVDKVEWLGLDALARVFHWVAQVENLAWSDCRLLSYIFKPYICVPV